MQDKLHAITTRILKTEPANWREFQFIQQEDFKELSAVERHKLKASLVSNNFIEPFYVWESEDGITYCLDGKHRTLLLEELISDGAQVPLLLPATFIECTGKKEAAKLVLIYSSVYAKITSTGFSDFVEAQGLEMDEIKSTINIPDINLDFAVMNEMSDPFDDGGETAKNQYGVIVLCANEQEQEGTFNALSSHGYKCKVVVT